MELYQVRLKFSQYFLHHCKISQRQRLPRNIKPIAHPINSDAINFVNNILIPIVETQYGHLVILSVVGNVFADIFHTTDVGEVVFGDMEDTHWSICYFHKPTAVLPSSISFKTNACAPILTLLPILTPPNMVDFTPIKTLSPIYTSR